MYLRTCNLIWPVYMCYVAQVYNSPFPVSPVISLIVLLGYRLKTVKMSANSFGLNHRVNDICPALTHNLGQDEPHFLMTKSYKKHRSIVITIEAISS